MSKSYRELQQENAMLRQLLKMALDDSGTPINLVSMPNMPPGSMPIPAVTVGEANYHVQEAYKAGYQLAFDQVNETYMPFFWASMALEKLAQTVDCYASITGIPQTHAWLRERLKADPPNRPSVAAELTEKLMSFLEAWHMGMGNNDKDAPDNGSLVERVKNRVEGLQRFVSGEDDGEYLREVCLERGGAVTDLILMINMAHIGGRQPGITSWRSWLAQEAKSLLEQHQHWTYEQAGRRIKMRLKKAAEKGTLSEIESEVWGKVESKSGDKLKEFIRGAISAYDNELAS